MLTISISNFHASIMIWLSITHILNKTYIFSELSVEGLHHFLLKNRISLIFLEECIKHILIASERMFPVT